MPQFRRGAAEIEKSTQRKGGGSFGKFAPSIYWTDDKEAKILHFLNPIEDIPRLHMINFNANSALQNCIDYANNLGPTTRRSFGS